MSRSPRRVLIVSLLCLVAAEATARLFWRVAYGVPLRHPSLILYAFYPEIRSADQLEPSRNGDTFDVLLLGGSVLTPDNGAVELALRERLSAAGHHRTRIFNLAVAGHTTRDSLLKYRAIPDARFASVVAYEGINDTAMNNVAPEAFREDYGHMAFYEVVNALAPYHRRAVMALPYTLHYLAIRARQVWRGAAPAFAGAHELKSVGTFERNLESIVQLASERGDPMVLTTYATHVPSDYSKAAFDAFRLDYVAHDAAIEMWGRPAEVIAAVARQNDAVRHLAGTHAVRFVDEARAMDEPGPYFNDVCHLTVAGSLRFADYLAGGMLMPATK